jgi:hypothetical protein
LILGYVNYFLIKKWYKPFEWISKLKHIHSHNCRAENCMKTLIKINTIYFNIKTNAFFVAEASTWDAGHWHSWSHLASTLGSITPWSTWKRGKGKLLISLTQPPTHEYWGLHVWANQNTSFISMWWPFLYSKQNDRFESIFYYRRKKYIQWDEREIVLRVARLLRGRATCYEIHFLEACLDKYQQKTKANSLSNFKPRVAQ